MVEKDKHNLTNNINDHDTSLAMVKDELTALRYAISHDLRAPIKTINSYLELVYEDFESQLPVTAIDYLDRIKNAGLKLENMVDGLLSLSKIYYMEFSPRKVNINNIVSQLIEQLRNKFPSLDIRVNVQPEMEATGDEDLIYLVYQKLLENAWKFCSQKAEPHIEIGMIKNVDQESVYYVKDNGPGIEMKYADRLFTPFQRQHSINRLEGIGIGLATVLRIIKRHGGKIWVDSALDKGATFNFTFGSHSNKI